MLTQKKPCVNTQQPKHRVNFFLSFDWTSEKSLLQLSISQLRRDAPSPERVGEKVSSHWLQIIFNNMAPK